MFLFNRLNRLAKPFGVGILALTLIVSSIGGALLFNHSNPLKAQAAAGNLDPSFNVAMDSGIGGGYYAHINTVNIQSDGQKIIGGNIPYYNGIKINNLARLAVDGALDTTFNTNLGTGFNSNGGLEYVKTTAIQTDGKILVGGDFTTINGVNAGNLTRLNSDGTLDTVFNTNIGTGCGGFSSVKTMVLQPDGKILVGGDFTTYQSVSRNGFLRLNSDGTLDTAFMTTIGAAFDFGGVAAIAVQLDGKILVGGGFTNFNGTSSIRLARLNGTGTIDAAFTTNIGAGSGAPGYGNVSTISVQSDGKILVGGEFDIFNGTNSSRILRLNSDGTNDTTFITNIGTGFNSYYGVKTFAIQSDGKILVGGEFTTFNGSTINFMLRLNSDGTRDTAFSTSGGTGFDDAMPTSYNKIRAITIQSDGKIIVGGGMRAFNGVATNNLVRLNTTGTLDTSFYTSKDTGINYYPNAIAVQSDGKVVTGGYFTFYNGVATNRIARLNSDGTLDTNFTTNIGTGFNDTVNTLVIQSDGKILVGGVFTTFNGTTVNRIARLNSDGTLDTAFITNIGTGFNNAVNALAIQADSSIVVGGSFTTFNSIASNYIARLTTTGTADTTFRTNIGTGFNNAVNALAIQADGNIVVGGGFSTFAGTASQKIARLNTTGTADTAFSTNIGTGFNSVGVYALAIQANGKIAVGGWFTTFNSIASNWLLRLNANGTRDAAFDTAMGSGFSSDNVGYSAVNALALQPDGKLLIGGSFNYFNNNAAKWLVRLNGDPVTIITIGRTETGTTAGSTVDMTVCIQSPPGGSFNLSNSSTWLGFDNTALSTSANTSTTASNALTTGLVKAGKYDGAGTSANGYANLAYQQVSQPVGFTTDLYSLRTDFTGDGVTVGQTGLSVSTTKPELIGKVRFTKTVAGVGAISLNTTKYYSVANPSVPVGVNIVNVPYDCNAAGLNLKANISAGYNTTTSLMNTTLNTLGIIPTAQPYNTSPWNYSGTETIGGAISANVVDWVLVEVRDSTNATVLERHAALLLKNGTIVDPSNQVSVVPLTAIAAAGNYNIILRHRNHLAISTSAPVAFNFGYITIKDFTTNVNTLGSNQTLLSTGVYGLKPGNTNGDSAIDASDRVATRTGTEAYRQYDKRDLNLDGSVDASDRQIVRAAGDSVGI